MEQHHTGHPIVPHQEGGEATAIDGVVVVDGPGSVAVTLTPDAADMMAERLHAAARVARAGGGTVVR